MACQHEIIALPRGHREDIGIVGEQNVGFARHYQAPRSRAGSLAFWNSGW